MKISINKHLATDGKLGATTTEVKLLQTVLVPVFPNIKSVCPPNSYTPNFNFTTTFHTKFKFSLPEGTLWSAFRQTGGHKLAKVCWKKYVSNSNFIQNEEQERTQGDKQNERADEWKNELTWQTRIHRCW